MPTPNYQQAERYVMDRLEHDLPPELFYHGLHHTKDHVVPDTQTLAAAQGVCGEEALLLQTGALYHDIGFVEQYWDNEPFGARIAEETLPAFGYTPGHIEVVKGLILATQFPQRPQQLLEEILCDADLYNLGGEDSFWIAGERLIRERIAHQQAIPHGYRLPPTLYAWYERQCRFLENHSFFTTAAQQSQAQGKEHNLETIKTLLRNLDADVPRIPDDFNDSGSKRDVPLLTASTSFDTIAHS